MPGLSSPIKIIFFGTPEFATPSLEAIHELRIKSLDSARGKNYELCSIVTSPDRPAGRGQKLQESPVKQWAKAHGIPVFQPERLKDPRFLARLAHLAPDVGVIAAYGKIIPKDVLDIPQLGVLNVHPSLLPRWRGASPIQYAILNGDAETGVTIMLTDEEMDHGPVLAQERLEIGKLENGETLNKKLAELGGKLLKETLPKWIAGKIEPQEQNHHKATYTKMLKREDGRIDWTKSAEELERQIRAFQPWPGSFMATGIKNKKARIKLLKTHVVAETESGNPGTVFEKNGVPHVFCKKEALAFDIVQPEGKQPMSGADFLRGHWELLGTTLR